ncbi:MAG: PG0541 family transporter-associated protein [Psychrilyobacter sp.]|uniref:PG0541 family transporter-associated protein n=1 Tax=Psychrilyobacter sp. TaxID=2586924 RepID=UPI003C72E15A
MELNGEYKELRVLFDGSLEELILEELKNSDVIKYAIISKLKVSWQKGIKHLNTHVWPGEDQALLVIVEKERCYELVEKFSRLKKSLDYNITFDISVRALEYINL